ncbi:glycosyltransferase family 1 protein [Psychrobacillus psychrotolerans]|uniref:glycosyltransferase family 1 protein n=1 Tax=Psychrobacillus psychrotolerans TaxID=126156 RepID=UPI003B01D5A1
MEKVIRVLHVLGRLDRGGAETMVMNLYRKIDRTQIQFDFIIHTKEKCDYNDEIMALGGRIYSVPQYTGKNHFYYIKEWNKFLKEHPEYKIIHGHVRSTATIYLHVAKKMGLITISHSHSTSSGFGISAIVKRILQYPIRYFANYLFACSKSAGIWLFGKRACKKDNFIVLNNAIDAQKFVINKETRIKLREKYSIEENLVIGHVGRFTAAKNHDFLIEIFKEVYIKNNNAVLLLVGDGELREEIEEKIIKLGLSHNVIFTGVTSDIPQILQAIDIFVFPSFYEGLGIAVIEAQAAGLPCIVSNTVPEEVYLTENINVVSLDDSTNTWANEIIKYSAGYVRKNTLNQIKSNGYDIETTTKFLQDFYLQYK